MDQSTSIENHPKYTERRVPRGEHQIYLRDYPGAGPAFVLMHGYPDNLGIYEDLAPVLAAAGKRVIAFDFLGYGASDKPGGSPYTAKNLEGDLDAVVRALELKEVILVGHDASGPTAIDWALDHEERVTAIALLNTFYDAVPTLKFPEFINLFSDPAYHALATAFISDPQQFGWLLQFQVRQIVKDVPPAHREHLQKRLASIVRSQFAAPPNAAPAFVSLTHDLRSSLDTNTTRVPELGRFERPVGLVWGSADPYLSTGVAEHLRELFPNAQLTLLESGHWPQIDMPEKVAKRLLELCDQALQPRTEKTTDRKKTVAKKVRKAAISRRIVRLDIPIQQNYDDFIRRFESAVPAWNRDRGIELVGRKASWAEVVADVAASAPHDFLLYWKLDLSPMMALAGNTRRATEYLMGNHVIAETMYRHDPAVALYVPLRCAVYEEGGGTRFTIEQPSTTLSGVDQEEITGVGIGLDRKLAKLLFALNVEAPDTLSSERRAA